MTELVVMALIHAGCSGCGGACTCTGACDHSSASVTEGAILLKTSLELLESSNGSIRLVLVLGLELGDPDDVSDGTDETEERDQPPDQGREWRGILRSQWSDLRR